MNITLKATLIGCLVFFIIGGVIGGLGVHYFMVHPLALQLAKEQAKPPVVQTQVQTLTNTVLKYVPGETVYLTAPATATNPTPASVATKLDGNFNIGKPTFVYEVNGKPGVFTKADNEAYVFDKNEIALTQTSTVTIKAEIPTIDNTRKNSLGVGIGYRGGELVGAALVEGPIGKDNRFGWWLYGDHPLPPVPQINDATVTTGLKVNF